MDVSDDYSGVVYPVRKYHEDGKYYSNMIHNSFFLLITKNYQCTTNFSSDYFLDPLQRNEVAILTDYPENHPETKIAGSFIRGYLQKTSLLRSEGETGLKKKMSNKADYYSGGLR